MKMKMNTKILPIIIPGLYGTYLGDCYGDISEECEDSFKELLCREAENYMNQILYEINDKIEFSTVCSASFHSPKWYNYENDWLEFEINTIENIRGRVTSYYYENEEEFLQFAASRYGSYDGFISFFPYTKCKYERALQNDNDDTSFIMAIAMMIMFLITKRDVDLDAYQRMFEDEVEEKASDNGWRIEEDE